MNAEVSLSDCQVVVEIDVQWRDLDVLAHVNNAEYIKWFECARIAALERIGLLTPEGLVPKTATLGPILGAVGCKYLKPVGFPARVQVGTYLGRLGNASFNLDYIVSLASTNEVVALGDSVVVHYNYQTQRSEPLTDEIKATISDRLAPKNCP